MKLMHVVSKPTIDYVLSNHHIVFYPYYEDPEYVKAYSERAGHDEILMQGLIRGGVFSTPSEMILPAIGLGVNVICIPVSSPMDEDALSEFFASEEVDLAVEHGMSFGLVLSAPTFLELSERYVHVCEDYGMLVSTICFPIDPICHDQGKTEDIYSGWIRFKTIARLIEENLWDHTRHHHLYGLFNSAEMVAYKLSFTDFISSSIYSASTALCFLSSLWGMSLSKPKGLFYRPIEECFSHGTFGKHLNTSLDNEQRRLFALNEEIMSQHADGIDGHMLYADYLEKAKREGVQM